MRRFKKIDLSGVELEEVLLSLMLVAMLVICTMQVVWRYVIQSSLSWSEELARYIFAWLVWLAAAYATKKLRHLRITFLQEIVPERFRWLFDMLALVMSIVFAIIFGSIAVKMVGMIAETGQRSPAMRMPMWIPYLSVPVGLSLIGVRALQNVFYLLAQQKKSRQLDQEGSL